ncbi:MAG: histidinol-phosphate transaminase [Bacteroidetes bacterium]|nr:histidinol-phosphate transaminase [Bacteroidota bacterium]
MKAADLHRLVRQNVLNLKPYSTARDEFQGKASVLLDANELPFTTGHNRYPDPHQRILKETISAVKLVPAKNIFAGNGSDEAIDLLYRVFCNPGTDQVIIPQPTYGMYSVSASINDVTVHTPSLTRSFDIDTDAILDAVTPRTKIIFLCSPNNPSGNLLTNSAIENLLNQFNGLVVVDEAYIDFADTTSWVPRLQEYPNLIVLQTLSKAWGLAGLRLGLCFAHEEVIGLLDKVKPPYNINVLTQKEAHRFLTTRQIEMKEHVQTVLSERNKLADLLPSCSAVDHVFPSNANFLLVRMKDAQKVYHHFVRKGIIVRDRSSVTLCEGCLRITVGTPEENHQLIQALKLI